MKKAVLILGLLFGSFMFLNLGYSWGWDCVKGKGQVVERIINLENFHSFSVGASADVIVKKGKQSVTVKGQSNLIDLLKRDVKNGKWQIDFEKSVCYDKDFTVYITLPNLETVSIDGSGDVQGQSAFSGEQINLQINGSGDISMELDAEQVQSKINGSGDIDIKGNCSSHLITIAGSGDVSCSEMQSKNTTIKIMGSGDCKVYATEELKAQIMGSGDVRYKGSPQVESKLLGSGEVSKM